VEWGWSLRYKSDHEGTFFQGNIFPVDVAAAGDFVRSSVVYAGDFCNEDSGT